MNDATDAFLQIMSGGDYKRSLRLAVTYADLVAKAAEMGELEVRTIVRDGKPVKINVPRPDWTARLLKADEVGAFDRMGREEVIMRILSSPEAT